MSAPAQYGLTLPTLHRQEWQLPQGRAGPVKPADLAAGVPTGALQRRQARRDQTEPLRGGGPTQDLSKAANAVASPRTCSWPGSSEYSFTSADESANVLNDPG
jgi:hypothetical protein